MKVSFILGLGRERKVSPNLTRRLNKTKFLTRLFVYFKNFVIKACECFGDISPTTVELFLGGKKKKGKLAQQQSTIMLVTSISKPKTTLPSQYPFPTEVAEKKMQEI